MNMNSRHTLRGEGIGRTLKQNNENNVGMDM